MACKKSSAEHDFGLSELHSILRLAFSLLQFFLPYFLIVSCQFPGTQNKEKTANK